MSNINLTATISQVLEKIFADMPKDRLFAPILQSSDFEFKQLTPGQIAVITNRYLVPTGTILAQPEYATKFIEFFIKYFQDTQNLADAQYLKQNVLLSTDAKLAGQKHFAILQLSHIISGDIEKAHISATINNQATFQPTTQTSLLTTFANQNDLLLVRGQSGKFDQFVTKDQLDAALTNPARATQLTARITATPQVFNTITPQPNSPITIKQGSQTTTGPLAVLEAQFYLKKARAELAFLTSQDLNLDSQLQVDIQRRKIIAELSDQQGQKVLMQANLIEDQNRYTFTFMTGQLKGQIITLSRQQFENYRRQKLNFAQIFQHQSQINSAQQADDQKLIIEAEAARQKAQALRNVATGQYAQDQAARIGQTLDASTQLANAALPEKINITGTRPPLKGKITIKAPPKKRIAEIQQKLRAGQPVTGALQAKKALAARKAQAKRSQEVRETDQQQAQPTPRKTPKQQQSQAPTVPGAKIAGVTNLFSKAKGSTPSLIGKLFAGGTLTGASAFSFLDILDII